MENIVLEYQDLLKEFEQLKNEASTEQRIYMSYKLRLRELKNAASKYTKEVKRNKKILLKIISNILIHLISIIYILMNISNPGVPFILFLIAESFNVVYTVSICLNQEIKDYFNSSNKDLEIRQEVLDDIENDKNKIKALIEVQKRKCDSLNNKVIECVFKINECRKQIENYNLNNNYVNEEALEKPVVLEIK